MEQRINIRLIIISIVAVMATAVSVTFVYYELFQEQVKKDLRIEAGLIGENSITEYEDNENIRITLIAGDGSVLFDNDADAQTLSNHKDRPEVADAFDKGSGESVRKSDTMNMRTFYYAMLLPNGNVLRVAKEARSMMNMFLSVFPVIILVVAAIIFLCVMIGYYLTQKLLQPIKEMAENLDYASEVSVYRELSPFVDRIREQHEDILNAVRSRQDFTANVSHELKTPLTAISGYAGLIENEMVGEDKQVRFAGEIRKNADRLISLINDIIRLSELDHNDCVGEFTQIDLYEVARDRYELLRDNGRDKNIEVSLEGESCIITSSRAMMIELIDNLVQNGIRYNVPNGRVTIQVHKSENQAVLTVADTGIGIPKEEQDRVFERFYRVDKSRSRETGGTGLGLAIVKHIVEIHDGSIELESEPGKGTRIVVKL